jgi:hypothetical protein
MAANITANMAAMALFSNSLLNDCKLTIFPSLLFYIKKNSKQKQTKATQTN